MRQRKPEKSHGERAHMLVQVEDRRIFDRFTARFPVKFRNSKEDFGTSIFLRDVSAEGAHFASRERVNMSQRVDLLVELPDGHDPLQLNGNVVWVRGTSPNTWDVGIKFDRVDFMSTQRIFKYCQ